jgi:gluconokinase
MAPSTATVAVVATALVATSAFVVISAVLARRKKTFSLRDGNHFDKELPFDDSGGSDICLCVDIGSSSVRCAAFFVPSCSKVAGSDFQDYFSVLDMATGVADVVTIQEHVESTVHRCLLYLRNKQVACRVKGVGLTSFAMNLVGVDSQGNAVTPVYTYADTNNLTTEAGVELRKKIELNGGVTLFYDRTGVPVHRSYASAQLLRVLKENPTQFQSVAQWQSIAGFIFSKWTGKASMPMSYSEASWTGLLDWRKLDWYWPLIDILGLDKATLPPLVDFDSGGDAGKPLKGLEGAYSKCWPELVEVPLFLSVGDGAAANIGSKCYQNDRIAITIGTSAATRVMFKDSQLPDKFTVPKGLWCYRVNRETILIGGALTDGGSVFEWMGHTLHFGEASSDKDMQMAIDAATSMPADSHGLTVLPFLSGERAPGWKDDARAVIFGLRRKTTGIDILRAGFESVSHRLTSVINLIRESGVVSSSPTVIASGAALSQNQLWRQILSDSIGVDVITEEEKEATARGVASLISLTLYHEKSLDKFICYNQDNLKCATVCVPCEENGAIYAAARRRQNDLYEKLM